MVSRTGAALVSDGYNGGALLNVIKVRYTFTQYALNDTYRGPGKADGNRRVVR